MINKLANNDKRIKASMNEEVKQNITSISNYSFFKYEKKLTYFIYMYIKCSIKNI